MKNSTIKLLLTAIAFTGITAAASAAPANMQIQAPSIATVKLKPDLVIGAVGSSLDASDEYHVSAIVRNIGPVKSDSAIFEVKDMANGLSAYASIPSINPNSSKEIIVKFPRPIKKGDQLHFIADAKNHVNESNESNNTKDAPY